MKNKAIFLDRDGTINVDTGYFGRSPNWRNELELYPGIIQGIKRLRTIPNSYIFVATNQAGVARGFFDCTRVEEINNEIDGIFRKQGAIVDGWDYCPYVDENYAKKKGIQIPNQWVNDSIAGLMRKPNIGMLSKILENQSFNQDETEIYFVGDKITDVETGLNARGLGILIDNGENEEDVKEARVRNIKIAENLLEAANYILNNKKE